MEGRPGGGHISTMTSTHRKVTFDQDRLDAYNLARSFTREIEKLMQAVPRGNADHLDQLRRATLSLTLNTAEGSGEFKPNEKARFYRMARRSGVEAAAVLDSFIDRGILHEHDTEPARAVLHRAVGALTRLVPSVDPDWTRARRAAKETTSPLPPRYPPPPPRPPPPR